MTRSEQVDMIYAALHQAQAEWPDIPRSKEVEVKTERSGTYKFRYAPLDKLIHAVRPILAKNGLGFHQGIHEDFLVTTIFHASGQWIAHHTPFRHDSAHIQQYGSLMTYKRRYALKSALGIESDDDDEGAAAMTREKTKILPNTDPWELIPKEQHESLRRKAYSIVDCFSAGQDARAKEIYDPLTNDEKLCVWKFFDSKQRKFLKGKDTHAITQ